MDVVTIITIQRALVGWMKIPIDQLSVPSGFIINYEFGIIGLHFSVPIGYPATKFST